MDLNSQKVRLFASANNTFPWNYFCHVICGSFNDSVNFYDSNQMLAILQLSASMMIEIHVLNK